MTLSVALWVWMLHPSYFRFTEMHRNENNKIVKNQYGKEWNCIIKDIKINQQTETDVEDTISISFINSVCEEMKYKTLKEQLPKDFRLDVMNLIESSSKST